MLMLALFLALCAGACKAFNVTYLDVPGVVGPGQREVVFECHYDANLTLLTWFKDHREFFRYRPGAVPSTHYFPTRGLGSVEALTCGHIACKLKLETLTEEASGMYRCDIERDVPPYMYALKKAYMRVYRNVHGKPLLEGLAEEYGDGDMIQARCRGAPESELRWYINGHEVREIRGLTTLKKQSHPYIFKGILPRIITVQCAEFRSGKIYGWAEHTAKWIEAGQIRKKKSNVANRSNVITGRLGLLSIFLCLLDVQFYV